VKILSQANQQELRQIHSLFIQRKCQPLSLLATYSRAWNGAKEKTKKGEDN
jgi:hypothetical protein